MDRPYLDLLRSIISLWLCISVAAFRCLEKVLHLGKVPVEQLSTFNFQLSTKLRIFPRFQIESAFLHGY
jgi:hypothetical protein